MSFSSILSLIHGIDYLATLLLFGSLFFDQFIDRENARVGWIKILFYLAFVTTSLWMLFTAVDMADGWNANMIWYAMSKTRFAHFWCVRVLVLAVGCLMVNVRSKKSFGKWFLLSCSAVVLVFSSLTGHAAMSETFATLRVALDYVHTLSAAVWTGGLISLYFELKVRPGYTLVKNFSKYAMAATGVLFITGLAQVYLIENSFTVLIATDYGKLVILKFALFSAAMLAAAINHFVHLRNWKVSQEARFAQILRREIRVEMALIAIVIMVTGFLTRTNLPGM